MSNLGTPGAGFEAIQPRGWRTASCGNGFDGRPGEPRLWHAAQFNSANSAFPRSAFAASAVNGASPTGTSGLPACEYAFGGISLFSNPGPLQRTLSIASPAP